MIVERIESSCIDTCNQGHDEDYFLDERTTLLLRTTDRARAVLHGIAEERDRVLQDAVSHRRDIGLGASIIRQELSVLRL